MKNKILMIIAFKGFRDEEYFIPKSFFESKGFFVETASTEKGLAIGVYGGEANVRLKKEEINVKEFDAIIFVGGPKALDYLDNDDFYKIAKETFEENIVLGAICIAPIVIANAGLLKGKRATVWSSDTQKKPIKLIKEKGAKYDGKEVVSDGNIVTGNGPDAANIFAQKINQVIENLTKITN